MRPLLLLNTPFRVIYLLLMSVILASCNLGAPATTEVIIQTSTPLSCNAIIRDAIDTVGNRCQGNLQNQACYGYQNLSVELNDDSASFSAVGDVVDLSQISLLSASPLDEAAQTWGIAMIRAQADIAGTLPEENVQFLLFGATEISDISPQLNVFTLRTEITGNVCESAPPSALIMQSPQDTTVTMQINGAEVTFGSTLYLTAYANGFLTIATIEGHAEVTAFGETQSIIPGTQVRLSLGTSDGLQVISAPLAPELYPIFDIRLAPLSLLDRAIPVPDAVNPATETPTVTPSPTSRRDAVTPFNPSVLITSPPLIVAPPVFVLPTATATQSIR